MGAMDKDIELKSFFIFNSSFGSKEGEELKKILYYYPPTDNTDVQVGNVGLVEGIVQFTQTFKPSSQASSVHMSKLRQIYFQPEPNFWVVMVLTLPVATKIKDNISTLEYLEDDLQDNVYEAAVQQIYYMYRLFEGTFTDSLNQSDVDTLKSHIEIFFDAYLKRIKVENFDILTIFGGIQYLPLDRNTFLKIQCFVNALESEWDFIVYTAFLYNEHVIWSGVEPNDMQMIYQYLIGTLLPANLETELQGGSMPRNASSPFSALRHGRFITGPSNLKQAKTIGKIPKVFLFNAEQAKNYHLVIYRVFSATVCLFIEGTTTLTLDVFKRMEAFINPRVSMVVNDIADYCSKDVSSPSSEPDSSPKFIYFNQLNLAYKSTVHLDQKQAANIVCIKEALKIMADMKKANQDLGPAGENVVKTGTGYWVSSKTSNLREFYFVPLQKNANLMEINEEVRKRCESELEGIFFHPM